jgi:hypothetical protein
MKRHTWLVPDIYQGKGCSEKAALKMKLESNHTSVTIQNPPHLDLEVVKTPHGSSIVTTHSSICDSKLVY